MGLKQTLSVGKKIFVDNLPTILTGVGVVGIGVTAFLAGKGALAADKYLNENVENPEELDVKDKLYATYKCYIPAVVAGIGTAACVIGANRFSVKQLAAAATFATTTEKLLIENREKVEELFGEKGLRKLDEKLNEDHAARYFSSMDNVYETGHGSILCCEGYLTGTKFRATPEWIYKTVNIFNAALNAGEELCFNDFIEMLIPTIDINMLPECGNNMVFNPAINGKLMEIVVDSGLLPDTHEPYLIFTQRNIPIDNSYRDYM